MQRLLEFLLDNKEWLFSGLGVAILAASFGIFQKLVSRFSGLQKKRQRSRIIENGDIRIIGPRMCGKTTYLVALADWHYMNQDNPIRLIQACNPESQNLVNYAKNILEQGDTLEPTPLKADPLDLRIYAFLIKILHNKFSLYSLSLTLRDYPGEFFQDIADNNLNPCIVNYLNELSLSSKLMLMLDATILPEEYDSRYAIALRNLRDELLPRFKKGNRDIKDYMIAVVFTKFDQNTVLPYQQKPENFARNKFRRIYNELQRWSEDWGCSINYFSCSAFGLINYTQEANAIKLTSGIYVLKYPESWKPFGLAAPIFWLCTRQESRKLLSS